MLVRRLPSCRAGITHVTALVRSTGVLDGHSGSRGFKSVLKRLRKQLGQHLLKNPDVVRRIVDSANIQPNEIVLEIGPGTGNMTVHMLQKARAVFAVELDERMFETVNTRVQHMYEPFHAIFLIHHFDCVALARGLLHKFFCVRSDFLKMDLPPGLDCCVANIPYQVLLPHHSSIW
jgi:18S rRNA (adenine1779-N6/adenine1780-N6)-dimethyltransferase